MRKSHAKLRAHLMGGVAAAVLLAGAGQAAAEQARFDIPPQSLADALKQFGYQSGHDVLASPELASAKVSPGVAGEKDVELALNQVLDGSGLSWRRNGNTFLIVRADDPQSGSAAGDGADGTVEALIVTAQKREEDIQDVPIAISAFSQEDLTRSQVAGGPDLMTQIPNMTFTKTNFSSYSIQIRGIGTQAISATVDPAVAVAFNNTPFIRNRFFEQEFYDLQRIEVLRGPQGTLYGRNATAGVVNILSAKPTHRFEAKLSGDVANYGSTRLEGMINIPLAPDALSLRLAGAWTKREGYVTNSLSGEQIDGRDLWSGRLTLGFEPTDSVRAYLIYEHFEEDDDRLRSGKQLCKRNPNPTHFGAAQLPQNTESSVFSINAYTSQGCEGASLYSPDSFQVPNGLALPYFGPLCSIGVPVNCAIDAYASTKQSHDLRSIESQIEPEYKAESDIGEIQIGVDITPYLALDSETSYSSDVLFSFQDFNRFNTSPGVFFPNYRDAITDGNGVFCDPQLGCSSRLLAADLSTAESRQFSQELRLSSDFDGPFNFSLGANFLRYDTIDKYYVFFNSLTLFTARDSHMVWVPGVSDNAACITPISSDPTRFYEPVQNVCRYIDPNSIHSLDDNGRNYFLSKNPYRLISYAAFGEMQYQLAPTLKLTGGLRFTVDRKHAPIVPSWLLASRSYGLPVSKVIDQEWREPTGRVVLDWKPDLSLTDETLLYASYAHGYKAGGVNPPLPVNTFLDGVAERISASQPPTFGPEFVDAFEVGAKNTLLGGRLTVNANVFYYDYLGYQISQIANRSAVNLNFDAEVWGAELEADWRPLENLRLGFKGGYEKTRMANGSRAVDIMDRTAGHSDWVVMKPWPTNPSNCILPVWWLEHWATTDRTTLESFVITGPNGLGACVTAYAQGFDPATGAPYVPNPTLDKAGNPLEEFFEGYIGFDPASAPNNGEGFYKDLSGNELPNAPHFTGTLTADYTLPLPSDWLMTLHTDLYYQSEAWTRVFNTEGYDKLKAYTNVNLAAIFTNEDAGWKVMAYVKNVFDRDSITGAFLNSDDTALTTNVFLTEPRLYGIRVTKEWTGASWWASRANHPAGDPYPFELELTGILVRTDAPNEVLAPDFVDAFPDKLQFPLVAQEEDLSWSGEGSVKFSYAPTPRGWRVAAGLRYGRTAGDNTIWRQVNAESWYISLPGNPQNKQPGLPIYGTDAVHDTEEHIIVDFTVGKDIGVGAGSGGDSSVLSAGIRYAQFDSGSEIHMNARPDWYVPFAKAAKYPGHSSQYNVDMKADRSFKGAGPTLSWEASRRLFKVGDGGHADLEWSTSGGLLFGTQQSDVDGLIKHKTSGGILLQQVTVHPDQPFARRESRSVTVPTLGLGLGLSYSVDRAKVSAGYRWDRYFDVIDGGIDERKSYDRTIDGPYFKLAIGFGG